MERLAHLLEATTGDGEAVKKATTALEQEQRQPGFASQLLALCAVVPLAGYSLPAATYLKNYVRTTRFTEDRGVGLPAGERATVRAQLLEVVMRADGAVLKQLAEALRVLVMHDFRDTGEWPELLPALRAAIQHSNLMAGSAVSPIKTYNALVAVHTITKPFQYFQKPTEVAEPVPPQLEAIAAQLLEPLQSIYQALTQQAIASHEAGLAEHDALLHLLLKAFHHTVRSHLPAALVPQLPVWLAGVLALATLPVLAVQDPQEGHITRFRLVKRTLQICASMVARHRKHTDKYLQQMVTAAVGIVTAAVAHQGLHPLQERIVSLAFDLLAAILETGPGWRLLSPHFEALLSQAIFPALALQEQDVTEWQEDPAAYLSRNLPDDMDDVSGWRDDLLSPRRSAQNLLGLIALAKVSSPSRPARKGGKRPLRDAKDVTAGELIVLPALAQHAMPTGTSTSDVAQYYGVLQAYGALQNFYSRSQKPGAAVAMLRSRVLPLYGQPAPSPLLLATANWLLGEYADHLAKAGEAPGLAGDTLRGHVFDTLMKALTWPDTDDLDAGPVRLSAAGALRALLTAEFVPPEWLPLLQAAVAASRSPDDDETARAFQLLQTAAETGDAQVARHCPALLPVLMAAVVARLPEERATPWPAVAEAGVAALTQLVTASDDAATGTDEEDDEEEEEPAGPPYVPSPSEQAAVADCVAAFLARAWLPPPGAAEEAEPPTDSCLHDLSVLLASLLQHTNDSGAVERRRVSALVSAWAGLLSQWDAWSSEEDSAALAVIDQAVEKQKAALLPHFIVAPLPAAPLPPVPPLSPLEAIAGFLADAIESTRAEGVWRACHRVHALLHATALAFDSHEATKAVVHRVAAACGARLLALSSRSAPLAKPLVLALATCFLCSPDVATPALAAALGAQEQAGPGLEARAGVAEWAVRLAEVVARNEHGLTDPTEAHLAGAALIKVAETLAAAGGGPAEAGVAAASLEGAMRALLREAELQEEDSGMEEEDEEENEEEDDDEEEDEEGDDGEEDNESEQDETEAHFLARYAAAARELEEGEDDAEGGDEEDGQPLELGVLGLTSLETTLLKCLQAHGKMILASASIQDRQLLEAFSKAVPRAASYLRQC
ncbi:putative nuclear transport protein [Klebsormidium nitens]|uniref:Putative nuclear transport protein n=1 Tax=Klebsormidium nitens TaxID=105231 RepID=A0A1Y1IJH5_KLENI|nr:putative nuclear transport protein [Klebsormidium nitens]|eukprot:GAQ91020.1 putative nuclear transport protein [Klebsormidium nitens]